MKKGKQTYNMRRVTLRSDAGVFISLFNYQGGYINQSRLGCSMELIRLSNVPMWF